MKRFQILNFRFQAKNFKIFGVLFLGFFSLAFLSSCYSFTGNSLNHDEKTIQIKNFPNNAALVNPNLSQEFSIALQNRFLIFAKIYFLLLFKIDFCKDLV